MPRDPLHPITTPKGASAFTVILAVIGVFTPFFTSLGTAQFFAVLAIFLIGWLYWSEIVDVFSGLRRVTTLWLPISALIIIVAIASAATLKFNSSSAPTLTAPPALTISEVTSAVKDALLRSQKATPLPTTAPPARDPYQIFIEEARSTNTGATIPMRDEVAAPPAKKVDETGYEDLNRRITRMRVGMEPYSHCLTRISKRASGLYGLQVEATNLQNDYAYTRDNDKMVADLADWIAKVEIFFAEHKDQLPDVSVVKLANSDAKVSTFLGLSNSGVRAWASMDAKRKSIEAIARGAGEESCEAAKNAAIVACVAEGKC